MSATHQMMLARGNAFPGGNQSHADILAFCRYMAGFQAAVGPSAGGTLTINGASLGSYDYAIKVGPQTVSSFVNGDWFTATEDSRSAFVVVEGDLTINAGQVFKPSNRKLFTVVYVKGALAVNGEISMSQRGANHSAAGGNVSAAAIRIATGTFSSVTNPQVPAAGAAGGTGPDITTGNTAGDAGDAGSAGGTGGGGSGAARVGVAPAHSIAGDGAAGTSFSGGPGGGAASSSSSTTATAEDGGANGEDGGDGAGASGGAASGGAGNPGGQGNVASAGDGLDGTGGVLIIICEGAFSGSGSVTAAGQTCQAGSSGNVPGGGGSGGGSVTIMYGSDSGPTPTALGGAAGPGLGGGLAGGAGGNGTARKLAL